MGSGSPELNGAVSCSVRSLAKAAGAEGSAEGAEGSDLTCRNSALQRAVNRLRQPGKPQQSQVLTPS